MSAPKEPTKKTLSFSVRLVRCFSNLIDRIAVILLLLLCAYGIYGMWDTNQLLSSAQSSNLQQYKPEADDTLSFQELKEINDEVIAWLTVYGTKIDYPVTQADNDQKYVNTSVLGKYSLAGSIFLSSENAADFSDFNSIIYGHHMDKEAMFGGLDKFIEKNTSISTNTAIFIVMEKIMGLNFLPSLRGMPMTGSCIIQGFRRVRLVNLICRICWNRPVKRVR